jgi:ligand-binding sensor domain-containing protein/class 3 adenylate cyclase
MAIPSFFRSLAIALLLLHTGSVEAQRFYFETVGLAEGLPNTKVHTLLQDTTGMVWLGTDAGLVNYDGKTVTPFGQNEGLPPGAVRALYLDPEARLWVGYEGGGLARIVNGKPELVQVNGLPLNTDITGIEQDGSGGLWLSTMGQGVLRARDITVGTVLQVERNGTAQGIIDHVTGITALRGGALAFLEDGGTLKKLDSAKSRFVTLEWPGLQDVQLITAVHEDGLGRIWLGTRNEGAYVLDTRSGQVVNHGHFNGLPSNTVTCFGEDLAGQVWVGTLDGGAAVIGMNGVRRTFNPSTGMPGLVIRRFATDREGNMLIATNDAGLSIFKGERFLNFIEEDGLLDPQVWAVLEDQQGRMWFGTNGGITILDARDPDQVTTRTLTSQSGALTNNRVRCLQEDARGHIWIGTGAGSLIDWDAQAYRPVEHPDLSAVIPEGHVTALELGDDGALWIGTVNGLKRFDPGVPPTVFTEEDGVPTTPVTALYRDPQGVLWVGSTGRGITQVRDGKGRHVELSRSFNPTCFITDGEGRSWAGSDGSGIIVLKDGSEVARYTTEQGLLSNNIRSLATDQEGHIWIGTTEGLNKWRPKKDTFLSFTQRSGIKGREAKSNAICVTRGGDLWIGTIAGATRIIVEKGADRSLAPVVAIRSVGVDQMDRPLTNALELAHDERNIRITFGSVSLSDPDAVRYQYMLSGLDNEWQPITAVGEAYYPALPSGRYAFRVKAVNRAGLWSEAIGYDLQVLPPWYRTWWFYTALSALILAGGFSYLKFRERQLRMRNMVLEQRVTERTAEVVKQSEEIAGQKVRIEGLLLNILPKMISDELNEKGKATARRYENVTVMFTDMKGFTKVAEKMSPERLVDELDSCFVRFDDIMGKYGIEKIKTIGDSYMSACGVPLPDPHHAARAVLAALEIREEMHRSASANGGVVHPWILRIGLHSGPVVAGVVGKRKFAYDIWGDTVNTASRMESSGEPGQVNISETTYDLVKDLFVCDHRGQVEAKNKGHIDMYFVRRIKPEFSADAPGLVPNERLRQALGLTLLAEQGA